jgi:hypothetical protein
LNPRRRSSASPHAGAWFLILVPTAVRFAAFGGFEAIPRLQLHLCSSTPKVTNPPSPAALPVLGARAISTKTSQSQRLWLLQLPAAQAHPQSPPQGSFRDHQASNLSEAEQLVETVSCASRRNTTTPIGALCLILVPAAAVAALLEFLVFPRPAARDWGVLERNLEFFPLRNANKRPAEYRDATAPTPSLQLVAIAVVAALCPVRARLAHARPQRGPSQH